MFGASRDGRQRLGAEPVRRTHSSRQVKSAPVEVDVGDPFFGDSLSQAHRAFVERAGVTLVRFDIDHADPMVGPLIDEVIKDLDFRTLDIDLEQIHGPVERADECSKVDDVDLNSVAIAVDISAQ